MTFTLRDYQQELVDRTEALLLDGKTPCLVAPTGAGKTVMAAELVRRARERGERVVVAAHRHEIIKQLQASLARHLGERIGILTAKHTSTRQMVTVTMMPTLARRKTAVASLRGQTFILDEAHHLCSDSYQRLLRELEPARFLGLTATPITPTGAGLGKFGISDLVLGPQPRWLMDQGALCEYKLYAATGEVDTNGVSVRAGDYAANELQERVVLINGDVIRDYERFNPTQAPTIAVTITIDHAYELAEIYKEAGYTAEVVIGETPQAARQSAFDRFERGDLKVIVSVALIDEGLDLPAATCLQLLRPTKSLRLWKQLIGRVLRPAPGKPHAILIDHGGSWRDLPLPCEEIHWTLEGKVKLPAEKREVSEDREVVEKPPMEVQENKFHLAEIDPAMELGRRLLKKQAALRKNLYLTEAKGFPPQILSSWANNPQGVSPQDRRRIERLMNLPQGWIDQQSPQVV